MPGVAGTGDAGASAPPVSMPSKGSITFSKKELMTLLNIPEHLTTEAQKLGLRQYYARYQACITAQHEVESRATAGTWPGAKPTKTQVVEIFVSKSTYHDYMTKAFDDIDNYPVLKDWLEAREDSPSDLDVWGTQKSLYTFSDLKVEKARRVNKRAEKDKANEADKEGKEGKDEVKEAKKSKKKKLKAK